MKNAYLLLALSLFSAFASSQPVAEKPNIIFIFTDDQSFDSIGAFGNPDVKTPNIDSLANKGVVFDRHYNPTSICMPSRATVMTGRYEYKTGASFNRGPLSLSLWQESYPMLLKEAGYRTGFTGKFGFEITDKPLTSKKAKKTPKAKDEVLAHSAFDLWAGGVGQTKYETNKNPAIRQYAKQYPHSSMAYGALTADFIKDSVKENKPFAMSIYYKAPHKPSKPDPQFDNVYKETTFRKLPNFGREAGEHFSKHSHEGRQYTRFKQWGYSTEAGYQREMRLYHQLVHGIDQSIGLILSSLKEQGVADNTVIIFASDNGYFNGSHGFGSKVLAYEEASRVPLIIYDPRNKHSGKMRRTSSITGSVDITATILDVAGVDIPKGYDGVSLLPIIEKPESSIRDSLPLIQVWGPEATQHLAIMDKDYKYIFWYYTDAKKKLVPTEELYNITQDPFEMTNLANDPSQQAALNTMRKLYDQQVQHWKTENVKYHNYDDYSTLFDRSVDWPTKAAIIKQNTRKTK